MSSTINSIPNPLVQRLIPRSTSHCVYKASVAESSAFTLLQPPAAKRMYSLATSSEDRSINEGLLS